MTEVEKVVNQAYEPLGNIKINFRFLHVFLKEAEKTELHLPANTALIEVKKQIDGLTKKNFIFFLRESFIPSLDSKIGDLALCYGRSEVDSEGNKKYEITLVASENPQEYG